MIRPFSNCIVCTVITIYTIHVSPKHYQHHQHYHLTGTIPIRRIRRGVTIGTIIFRRTPMFV